MKFIALLVLILPVLAVAQSSDRGGSDGGGGNGVVCYDSADSKKIVSVELLDFYEGKILDDLMIHEQEGKYLEIFSKTIEKSASQEIHDFLKKQLYIKKGFKFLPKGHRLKPINDSSEIFIPDNCKVEQIANFQGPSRIFIVGDYWNLLSETHKAGLLLHEIIWLSERESGVKNSARARRSVARYFADNFQIQKIDTETKEGDFLCRTTGGIGDVDPINFYGKTSFYLKRTEDKELCKLSFITLNSSLVYSAEEAQIEGCESFISFIPYGGMGRLVDVEVRSVADQVITHMLTLTKFGEGVQGPKVDIKTQVEVRNMEFPSYNTKVEQIFCDLIR